MKRKWVLVFIALLVLPMWRCVQAQRPPVKEQPHFSAEDASVQEPTAIPKGVQDLLLKDESVREALDSESSDPKTFPVSWFSASVVHLGSPRERDLVIVGRGPVLGANITQYWVYRQHGNSYVDVFSGHAHDLVLLEKRQNGLKEIELLSATAVKIHTVNLRFNGEQYKVFHDRRGSTN